MKTKTQHPVLDISLLTRYPKLRILVVGDVMLDHYIQADVERTSPEAPVAVASVRSEDYILGGAANVAANLRAMGAKALVAGIAGRDPGADRLCSLLEKKGIGSRLLFREKARPTTLKTRILSRGQQIIRIDREEKIPPASNLHRKLLKSIYAVSRNISGVIISDYAKGVCAPDFLRSLLAFMRRRNIPVLCDPKGMDFSRYRGVDVLTPNIKETQEASGMTITDELSLKKAALKILRITSARALIVTRGRDGVSLFVPGKPHVHIPAHAREVYDVTGAGDTFISHFALALFSGCSFPQAAEMGNFASAISVAKLGVAVVTPEELSSFIRMESFSTKRKTPEELVEIVKRLKTAGKKVVFTNGCFDLIHIGHIKFLQAARQLGDSLIVGINTDASVRRIKGQGRPVITETERADILSALHFVDYVVLYDEATPKPLLHALKPDILVKGKNLRLEEIVGYDIVKKYGGEVYRLPFFANITTSDLLKNIFENLKKQV